MCFGTGDRVGLPGAGLRRRAGHVQLPASDKPGGERSRWAVAGNINAPGAVLSRGPIRRKVGFRPGLPSARCQGIERQLPAKSEPYLASRSEEHTSELQSLMRISYDVSCLQKKKQINNNNNTLQFIQYLLLD